MITDTKKFWYSLDKTELKEELETDFKNGLQNERVSELQIRDGKNVLIKGKQISFWRKLITHLKSPLIFILIIAGFITLALHHFLDSIVVFSAVLINLSMGIFQENKADKAFEKLNTAQKKYATVIRGGKQKIILIEELVQGDLVVLTAGVCVPADIRIIKAKNLLVNESVLTGEWAAVEKNARPIQKKDVALAEQFNMLWMGTSVSAGYGKGVVAGVGQNTQLGLISEGLSEFDEITPMRRKMGKLVRFLSVLILFSIVAIFLLGVFQGENYADMFLISVAVAVAVIPEGLPIAMTSVLAVGMKEILKKGGLVKNLLASETLGNVSVILTDKTGTITKAKMKLSNIWTLNNTDEDKGTTLKMAIISSDAFVEKDGESELIVRGRPLEKAIVLAGLEQDIHQNELAENNKRIDLQLFASENGYAVSLNRDGSDKRKIYVSGRPEIMLEKSKFVLRNGRKEKMRADDKKYFQRILRERSNQGMRLTAIAFRTVDWEKIPDSLPADLVFAGLLAFSDPIREDVKESIQIAKKAGVRVIMLTGDNPGTARKIAEEAGIIKSGGRVLVGQEIENMGDEELAKVLNEIKVFARMSPSQKLRVSKILKENGEITAMTGDGINDAPALRNASVGIAVESGTEVAKESADLILLGNSFSIIVYAIEEGRRIIDNLKKIVSYLLSTSFSEVFVIGGALLLGFPLPILASQILWINIIEEGLMSFAFVFEPKEKYLKQKDRRISNQEILTPQLKQMILVIGLITGAFLIMLYFILINLNLPLDRIRTIMFVALSIDSLFFAFSIKSFRKPIWKIKLFSNRFLIFAWLSSFAMIFAALYLPFLQTVLRVIPLGASDLGFLFLIGLFNLALIEIVKFFFFERKQLAW
ncbi:MAG: HAD-IC family P-type ATPase [Candidatus Pacebacteria bacterium]|nr:HAD-IC family P-type ATPase [Candidatus Paceibacterota bacterium]